MTKDCAHANCLDADWFNIVLPSSASIADAYVTMVSAPAASLRTGCIVPPICNWDQQQHKLALYTNHLMEIKLATYSFKRYKYRK